MMLCSQKFEPDSQLFVVSDDLHPKGITKNGTENVTVRKWDGYSPMQLESRNHCNCTRVTFAILVNISLFHITSFFFGVVAKDPTACKVKQPPSAVVLGCLHLGWRPRQCHRQHRALANPWHRWELTVHWEEKKGAGIVLMEMGERERQHHPKYCKSSSTEEKQGKQQEYNQGFCHQSGKQLSSPSHWAFSSFAEFCRNTLLHLARMS